MKHIYRSQAILKTYSAIQSCLLTVMTTAFFLVTPSTTIAATAFQGNLNSVSITDTTGTNTPPQASIIYSKEGDVVNFDATKSIDPDGNIVEYRWDFGDGTTATGQTLSHQFETTNSYPVTLTVIDNNNGVGITQIKYSQFSVAVNFQPASAPAPEGYLIDTGLAYSSTNNFGWTKPPRGWGDRDSNKDTSPDQAYDTMIMAVPTSVWEIAIPNGNYQVTVCVGDPLYALTLQNLQVEGADIIKNEDSGGIPGWLERVQVFTITDSRLTLTFTGTESKSQICWIKIVSVN